MASLESINTLLDEAVSRLSEAANEIRDTPLEPSSDHIRRIGSALAEIYDVQYHLFALQPQLTPAFLKGPFEHPDGAWNIAWKHAQAAEERGHKAVAIAILVWFATHVSSKVHEERARREIGRLRDKRDT